MPTFSLAVSAISTTFLCVNPGQSRVDWTSSSCNSSKGTPNFSQSAANSDSYKGASRISLPYVIESDLSSNQPI